MPSIKDLFTAAAEGRELNLTELQEVRAESLRDLGDRKRRRAEMVENIRKYSEACDDKNQENVVFDQAKFNSMSSEIEVVTHEMKESEDNYRLANSEVERVERRTAFEGQILTVGQDGEALMGDLVSTEFPRNGVYDNPRQAPMVRGGSVNQFMELFPETFRREVNGTPVDFSSMDYRKAFHTFASAHHKNRVGSDVMNKLVPFGDSGENYLYAPPQLLSLFLRGCDRRTFVRSLSTVITAPHVESTGIRKRTKKTSSFAWGCECTKPVCDTPGFGLRTLQPHPYSFCSCICRALLRRTMFNLEAFLADELSRDAGENMEQAFFHGDGIHKPLGLFTPSDDGIPASSDIETQTAGVVTADDLIKTWMALPLCKRAGGNRNPQTETGGASWIMHGDYLTQIMMLKTGDGQYIWRPWIRDEYPSELLGRPVYESEFAPNTMASGEYALMLADLSDYMIVQGPQIALERDDDAFTDQACWIGRGYLDAAPIQEESFKRLKLK